MNERSLAHTRWDCIYHMVWILEYRCNVLHRERCGEIGRIIRELVERKIGCEVVEGSVAPTTCLPEGAVQICGVGRHGVPKG